VIQAIITPTVIIEPITTTKIIRDCNRMDRILLGHKPFSVADNKVTLGPIFAALFCYYSATVREQCIAISLSVCLSVYVSVCKLVSK